MRLLTILFFCSTFCAAQNRVQTLAEAIAKAEGWGRKRAIPTRYHNPGDLKAVKGYKYPGEAGIGKGGHVRFRSEAEGWEALRHQIEKIVAGSSRYNVDMTLREISKGYAGNHKVWAKNVAHNLGVEPDTYLWEILNVPPVLVVDKPPAPLVF